MPTFAKQDSVCPLLGSATVVFFFCIFLKVDTAALTLTLTLTFTLTLTLTLTTYYPHPSP